MNRKASISIYGFMLALTILVVALALAPAITTFTGDARNTTQFGNQALDCSNTSISNFNKAACVATDMGGFYFIASLIFIAGGVITARFIW